MSDCRIATRMIAAELGISKGSVQIILKEDLNMWKLRKSRSESFDSGVKITTYCLLPRLDGE